MEQRAANVSITEPPILREKFLCQDLQLISIKYALREVPRDGDLTERGQGTPSEFEDFDPPYNSSSETPESDSNERKVTKMKPGKRYSMKPGKQYSMKLKAEYKTDDNTRSTIESDEIIVTTKPYRGIVIMHAHADMSIVAGITLCAFYRLSEMWILLWLSGHILTPSVRHHFSFCWGCCLRGIQNKV